MIPLKDRPLPKQQLEETMSFDGLKMISMRNKNMSPGFTYNTTYIGKSIKDNSQKPSAPMFSIGKDIRDKSKR